jgi:hypothetical protein
MGNLLPVSTTLVAFLPPVLTTSAVNFPTGIAGVIDTGGKFTEVGGPQISSTNRNKFADLQKFLHLWTVPKCGNLLICDLWPPNFSANLNFYKSANFFSFSLQIHT